MQPGIRVAVGSEHDRDPRSRRRARPHPAPAVRDLPAADAPDGQNPTLTHAPRPRADRAPRRARATTRPGSASTTRAGSRRSPRRRCSSPRAAERTKHIKLGTGVNSLPYHHPLILADRIVMLDHLTQRPHDVRRRARPADVRRVDARDRPRRPAADDGGELRRHHGAVPRRDRRRRRPTGSRSTRAACSCARTRPLFDIAVAASISPSGPKIAGRHGVGLLSVAATNPAGFEKLAGHWEVMEEQAAEHGIDRRPLEVADDGSDAHRRDRGAGGRGLPLRARAGHGLPRPRRADRRRGGDRLRGPGQGDERDRLGASSARRTWRSPRSSG